MRKGVILEINDLYLTLLTPEGEFLRARKLQQDYQVGEEIHFFPEMAATKRKKFNLSSLNSFKARTIALAAAFMLVLTAILPIYQDGKVYAYMSIDVNPSVEMAVSDELKVLRIKGYNPEGKEIIKGIKGWKKKDAAIVAEMILEEIEEKGYLKGNNDVIIATVPNGKVKEKVEKKLEKKIAEIKKATKEEKLELKVIDGTSEDREDAQELGVTTGVYKANLLKENKLKSEPAQNEDKPEAQKPANPVQKPANPVQMPGKQDAPGQVKKTEPELPKAKPVTPPAPGVEKKNDRGQNGNSYNSQSKNNYEKKVQQVVKSKSSNNGRQVKEERNRLKQDNNGHSGKSNGNSNKK